MLCSQSSLYLGREVWFFKVTFRGSLSTLEPMGGKKIPVSLTPLSLAEREPFPAQERAIGGKGPCGTTQLISGHGQIPCPLDMNWKGGALLPTSGPPSGLQPPSSSLSWPWLWASPLSRHLLRLGTIPSLHLYCFCEV